MNIIFKNTSTDNKVSVFMENQKYVINPGESVSAFCVGEKCVFATEILPFEKLLDSVNEDFSEESLKDRIFLKLTKILVEKLPRMVLSLLVNYEVESKGDLPVTVVLSDGVYVVCGGVIADLLDLTPICYSFTRVENENGQMKPLDVTATNRKQYLKLIKKFLLFMHWGLFFLNLTFFIPEYIIVKFCCSHFYLKSFLTKLYKKTPEEREKFLEKGREKNEK